MINKLLYLDALLSYKYIDVIKSNLQIQKNNKKIEDVIWDKYGHIYSYDEIINICKFNDDSLFNILNDISDNMINISEDVPYIDMKYVIDWQTLVRKHGEDLFVCAAMAQDDKKYLFERKNFNWKIKSKINDSRFNNIMDSGLAENHFHLKGSGPVAQYNFLSLMNSDNYKVKFFNKTNKFIYEKNNTSNIKFIDLLHIVVLERLIRKFLFLINKDIKLNGKIDDSKYYIILNNIKEYISTENYMNLDLITTKAQNNLLLNAKHKFHFDYCCDLSNHDDIYSGERALIYLTLMNWSNFNDKIHNIFNLYLILKRQIYRVFIQNNNKKGFSNFSRYDQNKDLFLTKKMKREFISESYKYTMENCNIKKIELRIAPKNDFKLNLNTLLDNNYLIKKAIQKNNLGENYYFVYHFIKGYDNKTNKLSLLPRNYKQRKNSEIQAKNIIKTINNLDNKYLVRGIDAANSEFNCRPEVYGQVFRFLRNIKYFDKNLLRYEKLNLSLTYHVGEDFIDIVDGIRAIEEAILFLNLNQGDRLGHCIALGINPKNYYIFKRKNIIKTKQNALDDFVYMYKKLNKYSLGTPSLIDEIKNEIHYLINYIYNDDKIDINDYFESIMLRGDNPEIYRKNYIKNYGLFEQFSMNVKMKDYAKYSKNNVAKEVYLRYHYDKDVLNKGNESYEFEISNDYIEAVSDLQMKLREYISEKGICIEVNPSSNYLIGPIKYYSDLPLMNFNKIILDPNKKDNIPISICTDDQGIFHTNLEMEYALVFNVLSDNGCLLENYPKYDKETVYEYINKLRKYSLVYSFYKK